MKSGKMEDLKVKEFLEDYSTKSRPLATSRLKKFIEWCELTPLELVELDNKKARKLLIKFNDAMLKGGMNPNSLLTYISMGKMFFAYHNINVKFRKGQIAKPEKPTNLYDFSNGDLAKIYQISNIQYKAVFALAASTGFGIGDILGLDRAVLKARIEQARKEGKTFCFYETQRRKTHARSLICINPLAMKSLELWFKNSDCKTLFEAKADAVNNMLRKLASQIGIDTTLTIKFHRIRSWLINSLIKGGFQTEQWKSVVGKSIGLSDDTYLSLKEQIKEKYEEQYDEYFNIMGTTTKKFTSEISSLRETVKEQQAILKAMQILNKKQLLKDARELAKEMLKVNPELEFPDAYMNSLEKLLGFIGEHS